MLYTRYTPLADIYPLAFNAPLGCGVRLGGGGIGDAGAEALAEALRVHPSLATHATWRGLKAGDLIDRVSKTLLDTT